MNTPVGGDFGFGRSPTGKGFRNIGQIDRRDETILFAGAAMPSPSLPTMPMTSGPASSRDSRGISSAPKSSPDRDEPTFADALKNTDASPPEKEIASGIESRSSDEPDPDETAFFAIKPNAAGGFGQDPTELPVPPWLLEALGPLPQTAGAAHAMMVPEEGLAVGERAKDAGLAVLPTDESATVPTTSTVVGSAIMTGGALQGTAAVAIGNVALNEGKTVRKGGDAALQDIFRNGSTLSATADGNLANTSTFALTPGQTSQEKASSAMFSGIDRGASPSTSAAFTEAFDAAIVARADAPPSPSERPVTMAQLRPAVTDQIVRLGQTPEAGDGDGLRVERNGRTAEIELAPADLGRLRLVLQTGERGLHLVVAVERPEMLEAVRRHLDGLHRALLNEGLTLDSVDIGSGYQDRSKSQNPQENTPSDDTPSDGLFEEDQSDSPVRPISRVALPGHLDLSL